MEHVKKKQFRKVSVHKKVKCFAQIKKRSTRDLFDYYSTKQTKSDFILNETIDPTSISWSIGA